MNLSSVLTILFVLNFVFLTVPETAYSAEQVYGWKLMSDKERSQYYQDIKNLPTGWERKMYQKMHYKKMVLRARKYAGISPSKNTSNNTR